MAERTAAFYVTSPDRVGLAIGAGGAMAGFAVMLLVAMGGQRDLLALLLLGWLVGGVFAMLGIVATAGPVWLALHVSGRRGPGAAAMTGASVAMLLLVFGQTWGFGAFAPPGDVGAGYRWMSAIATSLLVSIAAAGIGWAMQRVAYRRLM